MRVDGRIYILPPNVKNEGKPRQNIFEGMDQMAVDIRTFVERVYVSLKCSNTYLALSSLGLLLSLTQ